LILKGLLVGALVISLGNVYFPEKPSPVQKQVKEEPRKQNNKKEIRGNLGTFEATAYTAYCPGCSGTTAAGIDLRADPSKKVVAVDPHVIPLGTRVWVEGYGAAIAGDIGGGINGREIDVFIPNRKKALDWGRKQVEVKVIERND
jgi:3D (Asp-Asp-Asp) domain-containing protein